MGVKERKLMHIGIVAAVGFGVIALFSLLKLNTSVAEFLTRTLSRGWVAAAGAVAWVLPFSLFELCCYALAVWAVIALALGIYFWRKGRTKEGLIPVCRVIAAVVCIFAVYTAVVSPAYNRKALPLPETGSYTEEEAIAIAAGYIEEMNRLAEQQTRDDDGHLVVPDWDKITALMKRECDRVLTNSYFHPTHYPAKRMVSSYAMSQFGIIGVTFLPTGEVNLNRNTAVIDLPVLIAHETAHLSGAMREDDADTVSMLVALSSNDPYVRYSALINAYGDILQIALLNRADLKEFPAIGDTVRRDINDRNAVYRSYSDFIGKVGDFFNDLYLKINGVKEGTGSYQQSGSITTTPGENGAPPKIEIRYSDIQKLLLYYHT